jgi:hypothetical protein
MPGELLQLIDELGKVPFPTNPGDKILILGIPAEKSKAGIEIPASSFQIISDIPKH